MLRSPDEWVLLHVQRGSARALTRNLQSKGLEAFVPVLSATDTDETSGDLFPRHVLADATLEQKQSDAHDPIDWSFVTNRSNRPFVIPGPIAMGLKDPDTTAGRDLHDSLRALAPDYRIEQLMVECTRWRLATART